MGAAIGALASLLARLFGRQITFMADMFSKGVALRLMAVGLVVAALVALYATVNGILAGLAFVMPSELVIAASWVVPDVFDDCVVAYVSTHVAVAAYRWYKLQIAANTGSPLRYC